MNVRSFAKSMFPARLRDRLRRLRQTYHKRRIQALPTLSEAEFRQILAGELGLQRGDIVFVHSSTNSLHLAFSPFRILGLLRDVVGAEGTLLFPTYNRLPSYAFLKSGEVFDVKRSPSFTGLLTEFARRQPDAIRSLHPTKSVCALGPMARQLTADHHRSIYPYDRCSPYYRTIELGGKAIGVGVSTQFLSLMHCVDDLLREDSPVNPYADEVFAARCVDYDDKEVTVHTLAHDPSRLPRDVAGFVKRHIPPAIAEDRVLFGMPFFRADAKPLFDRYMELAKRGINAYPPNARR